MMTKETQKETQEKTQADTPKEKIYYDQRSVALRTTQSVYFVKEHDKTAIIELILNDYKDMQVVVFMKSKKKADALSSWLISKEFSALSVHGNHRESQQKEASSKFNLASLNIIITTDMIFKTLELENIKLVISHDLPNDPQDYYNRLAIMKEEGVAISLVNSEDEVPLHDIEVNMKAEIEEKIVEGFVSSPLPNNTGKLKRTNTKKPRHRKKKIKKEQEGA